MPRPQARHPKALNCNGLGTTKAEGFRSPIRYLQGTCNLARRDHVRAVTVLMKPRLDSQSPGDADIHNLSYAHQRIKPTAQVVRAVRP